MAPAALDPAQAADAVGRYLALRELRARLYGCLTARADALFELCDAILCADHAVTSLAELSLVPEFRRGHGALYDTLAAGQAGEEALAALLTGTLPQLIDGPEALAWVSEHDTIDYGLLEQALTAVPAWVTEGSGARDSRELPTEKAVLLPERIPVGYSLRYERSAGTAWPA